MPNHSANVRWLERATWLGLLLLAGFADSPTIASQIQARTENRFPATLFFKPAPGVAPGLVQDLAPLLFLEYATNEISARSHPDLFGKQHLTSQGLRTELTQPVVYYETDSLTLNGKSFPRLSYRWNYSLPEKKNLRLRRLSAQGVRLTMDSTGAPVIWEILDDTSGLSLVFVAESLERRAREKFKRPLPGRKYVIENAVTNRLGPVVARVIQDGPVPMGPSVYLVYGTRDALTVICRCMPPQAVRLEDTLTYQLLPREPALSRPSEKSWDNAAVPNWVQALRVLPE